MIRILCRGLLVLILCAFAEIVNAQGTSNKGTDFWVAYAGHIDGLTSRMTLFLSSDINTSYTVTANGQEISSGNIIANNVTAVFIDPNNYDVYIGTSNVTEINKGINIVSAKPISVYCVLSNNARTGSSLILPTSTLESEYYVFSQQNKGSTNGAAYSEFTIVGVKDGTTVEIKPTQTNINGSRRANQSFQINLNKGDVYQYQAVNDLTGSSVKSVSGCTPIAVFSGNTWAAYCEMGNTRTPNGGDNIYQQLFPVTAWGKNFVSAPFYNTQNGNADIIRIIVSEDNTIVNVNGSTTSANGTTLSNPYAKGSVITFYSTSANVIKASAAIAVAQYQTSQTCNLNNNQSTNPLPTFPGDPEMTILNPIEQTLNDITVYSKLNSVEGVNTNIEQYYLNIILRTADAPGFKLDGSSILSLFKPIADGEYSYAVVDVTNAADQHRLVGTGGFTAIAYGYGRVESYAYLAGTDLKNLKSNISVFSSGTELAASNFCIGTNFKFVLKLPYITDKITWNLNNGAKVEVANSPTYTLIVEDDVTYYLYNYTLSSNYFTQPDSYNISALIQKPSAAVCATDETIFTTFDVFSPEISSPSEACINTDVQFNDVSKPTGGNIKSWRWNFGDGVTSNQQNPLHKYLSTGLKTVALEVVTDLGCALSVSRTINILASPKSNFKAVGPFCVNNQIVFQNETTALNTNVSVQSWDFGNGKTSKEATPFTVYEKAGKYSVRLISTSLAGCADTVTKDITIYDLPVLDFKDPAACISDEVQFDAVAVQGDIVSWQWDFGDGSTGANRTLQNAKHKYSAAGNYRVSLVGLTSEGCLNTFAKDIVISAANPLPIFTVANANNICANVPVSFTNRSTIGFGNITKIEWIFDYKDGQPPKVVTDELPYFGKVYQHQYENLSVKTDYKVVMRAYSGNVCFIESQPTVITVHPAPILDVELPGLICENEEPIQLKVAETNGVNGYAIFSGTGVSSNGIFSPSLSGAGHFNIKYIFTTDNGCSEERNINITVAKYPVVYGPEELHILSGGEKRLDFKANSSDFLVKWAPAVGLSSDDVLNPIAKPEQTTRYTLTISTSTCVVVKEVVVVVHEKPSIPNAFSPNGDGKNDQWNINYLESYIKGSISIFNRYGQQVFYASPYNTPWDGRFNGSDLPVGVYYYVIDPNNGRKKYTGSVTILK